MCDPEEVSRTVGDATTERIHFEEGQFRGAVSCAAVLVPTGDPEDPWWAVALSASSLTFRRRQRRLSGALRLAATDLAS